MSERVVGKLISFTVRKRSIEGKECRHHGIVVDPDLWQIECEACGAILDPIAWLVRIGNEQTQAAWEIDRLNGLIERKREEAHRERR